MAEVIEDSEIITATAASRAFSDLLHRVCYGGESFVIKKGQRFMARMTPVEVPIEMKRVQEIAQPASLPSTILDVLENIMEPVLEPVTGDEAEFYRAWMEQVRKVDA